MSTLVLLLALFSVSLNAMAQIFLRQTMLQVGQLPEGLWQVPYNPWFLLGICCYAFSIGLWLYVLSKIEVSAAYPLLSVGYVITAVVGVLFLGENMNPLRVSGIVLICLGLVLIARSV